MRVSATPFSDPRQLDAIDEMIAASPGEIGLHFGRACCLEDLGRIDEALKAYVDVLTRQPSDEVVSQRVSRETGAVIDTPWTRRRRAVLVASEQITDEPWAAVAEGTLLKVRRRPTPEVSTLAAL